MKIPIGLHKMFGISPKNVRDTRSKDSTLGLGQHSKMTLFCVAGTPVIRNIEYNIIITVVGNKVGPS